MKIILSPAKKMIADTDNLAPVELPVYIDKKMCIRDRSGTDQLLFCDQ